MRKDALALLAVFALAPPKCLKKKGADADASADAAASASASASATVVASAPPPPPDPSLDDAKAAFAAIEWDVAHGVLKDKTHPDELDAVARCAQLDDLRTKLEARPEPEAHQILDESKKLCNLDVPLLNANEELRQLNVATSQASRRLVCKYVQKDITKAKAFSASDRHVRELEQRWAKACLF
jgi:hypothetical protein